MYVLFGVLQANNLRKDVKLFNKNDFKYVQDNLDKYKKQCEDRDGVSCRIVSIYYDVTSHYDEELERMSFEWAIKGCNLRDGASCGTVGSYYGNADERTGYIQKDEKKAFEFFTKSCDYKSGFGCAMLGFHYIRLEREANSKSDKKEYTRKAKFFFKKGCDYGYKASCSNYRDL
ncbi:sel1 repeat family protein [Helicobacter sp. MIT 99-5507]|uniref:sel1 repeat family protein n=1 Tax=Helicobacter sp. MIT 99-5507 TaxID=152489 RepID=UPI000E1EB506|nr:sel1 repeat family protein [Helicobacter sp. MIT 99-5507]RDU57331.1 hypothetical protein CQA42_05155 [Helicobacter sp. MIT 99-5507]